MAVLRRRGSSDVVAWQKVVNTQRGPELAMAKGGGNSLQVVSRSGLTPVILIDSEIFELARLGGLPQPAIQFFRKTAHADLRE